MGGAASGPGDWGLAVGNVASNLHGVGFSNIALYTTATAAGEGGDTGTDYRWHKFETGVGTSSSSSTSDSAAAANFVRSLDIDPLGHLFVGGGAAMTRAGAVAAQYVAKWTGTRYVRFSCFIYPLYTHTHVPTTCHSIQYSIF